MSFRKDVSIIPSQIQCFGGARKYITGTTLEEFRGEHCGGTLVFTRVGKRQGS